jgi:tetratricopeptide (TPR) repeat protein
MPPEPDSLVAVKTLALFADARIAAIWNALRKKEDWPGEWMTDVNSAFSVLARHPLGTDSNAVVHFDFLDRLGARRRAARVLEQALERWPASAGLHDRLRTHVLDSEGVAGLRKRYEQLLAARPQEAAIHWFAGYAAIVEAEYRRRDKHPEQAVEAYQRAIALLDQSIERAAHFEPSADHFVALALAALARLAIEAGDLPRALELCLQGIARHPQATPVVDGLEISPVQTARLLESRLETAKDDAGLARLREVLQGLDPSLLELPAYEQGAGNDGPRRGGRRRGR